MWQEFLKHPCWLKIEAALKARLEALQRELEHAACQGETIKAARITGAIEILRWVMGLPQHIDLHEKSRYNNK
jgi:hypothetical protein